jgi:hypothetical protein
VDIKIKKETLESLLGFEVIDFEVVTTSKGIDIKVIPKQGVQFVDIDFKITKSE